MPSAAFLMTGAAMPFRLAEPCPVMSGPHHGKPDREAFLIADVATRDRTAVVRVASWRCEACGVLLVGIGRPDAAVDAEPGAGIHNQEFAWLEESVVLLNDSREDG